MPETTGDGPFGTDIRVLRGDPDAAEVAALVAVLGVLGRQRSEARDAGVGPRVRRPAWLRAGRTYRSPGSWAAPESAGDNS
jgi:hypothetical protein